ncbi:DUF885 domain-containing protein [Nocardia sp. CDC160]|uniref:DUF885 domain-containing protein n=1 Tax=Nocardia sp. CDC160 TaxID=3112166 RepID=UPI002DBB2AC5|nr:DUF885 domain-containing protein [Nocardia sp. CDC160]MEC3920270.1 DUF885 domain-containing protein [Nocardia sp. CDC160]
MDLTALLQDFCTDELTRSPVTASRLGADPTHDSTLPDLSETGRRASAAADRRWVSRLDEVDSSRANFAQQLDCEVALAGLRGRLLLRDWHIEQRSAELYTSPTLVGVQALFQHRLRPPTELARDAAARLRQAPELLHQARIALDPSLASQRLLRRAANHARAGAAFCRNMAGLVGLDDTTDHVHLHTAGDIAADAYEQFAIYLTKLADNATGDPVIGETRYTALLATKEGSRLAADDVYELGTQQMRQIRQQLAQLYRDHPDLRTSTQIAAHPATTTELLDRYRTEVVRARQFCIEHSLLTLPDNEHCDVAPTPEFQLALLPVASYQPPALLSTHAIQQGCFLVPAPPPNTPPENIPKLLATQRVAGFANTTIHETYPGHHAHHTRMATTVREHPVRALFPSAFFNEGWGFYVEQLAHQHGYFTEPESRQAHLGSALVRAARATVDSALHSGDMTCEQAESYLIENVRLPHQLATAEIDRYLAYPTQAASYLVGATEIASLVAETDATPQRHVHDQLTSSGALPLRLAARATRE